MTVDLSLYLVTDSAQIRSTGRTVPELVAAAVAGGVSAVQVREKTSSARDFLALVVDVAAILPPEVALFVNDRVDVFLAARQAGAAVTGVHVGQSDLPVVAVREMIGADAILGLSAATEDELRAASESGVVDYVGIGALHPTRTKADAPPALGVERFRTLVAAAPCPAVAIGGVTVADLPELRAAGASGAAIVSAVCLAPEPVAAARALRDAWDGTP